MVPDKEHDKLDKTSIIARLPNRPDTPTVYRISRSQTTHGLLFQLLHPHTKPTYWSLNWICDSFSNIEASRTSLLTT